MRLGQLARKVNVKTGQIIAFLEKEHNITIEDNLNFKVEQDALALVLEKFAPETIELEHESEEEKAKTEVEDIVEDTDEKETTKVEDVIKPKVEAVKETESQEDEVKTEENIKSDDKLVVIDEDGEEIELKVVDGVIKAPKKELEGFKVVGKIELPEKKRSISFIVSNGDETTDITEEIFDKKQAVAKRKKELYLERKRKRQEKSKHKKKGTKKRLSEIELKERANKLAVEKQVQQSKKDKSIKKKHYLEQVQSKQVPKKLSKKKKKKDALKAVKTYDKEPTTTWGKIVKWFNT